MPDKTSQNPIYSKNMTEIANDYLHPFFLRYGHWSIHKCREMSKSVIPMPAFAVENDPGIRIIW